MNDEAVETPLAYQQTGALQALEQILADYKLPPVYNQLLLSPWTDLASAVLEEYGEESDGWRRMIWFSRIVCNAIFTTLEQKEAEPLEEALQTFMTWLSVCNHETDSLELACVAAEYLCRRLKTQVAKDLEELGKLGAAETNVEMVAKTAVHTDTAPEQPERAGIDNTLDAATTFEAEPAVATVTDAALALDAIIETEKETETAVDTGLASEEPARAGIDNTLDAATTFEAEPAVATVTDAALALDTIIETEKETETAVDSGLASEEPERAGIDSTLDAATTFETEPAVATVAEVAMALDTATVVKTATQAVAETETETVIKAKAEADSGNASLLNNTLEQDQAITDTTGSQIMEIPTLAETFDIVPNKQPESISPGGEPQSAEKPAAAKSLIGQFPIGVWLGFHDEDVSTMVRLAVYDRQNDNYIFANKQGFLVRQLNTPGLLELIENQLVDIIDRRQITRKPSA